MAFLITKVFLTIFDTTVDTIFICFLIDEQSNKNVGLMMADEDLRDIVQKYEKHSQKIAARRQRSDKIEKNTAIQLETKV